MAERGRRVVILGAGFAGLFAAVEFERLASSVPGLDVTLLDRNNYHLFVPLLYHVGTGGIEPGNIVFPIRSVLRNGGTRPPVVFRECEIQSIDTAQRKVTTDRAVFDYDYLILALGSTTNYYGIPGLEEHIVPLKTLDDGVRMHNRILESFEAALLEADETRRRTMVTFVIVGGGATGVELGSTLALFIFKTLVRDFPSLIPMSRVMLVEAGGSLLHGMPPRLGKVALNQLSKLGVEVLLNCRVAECTAEGIKTADGRMIGSRNVTWVGGVKPTALADAVPAQRARDGRIIVGPGLNLPAVPGVYVAGDCAYALQPDGKTPYSPTAQVATRMGVACARNLAREMAGFSPCPFDFKYKGDLVFLGRNNAVGEVFGLPFGGFPGFLMYQGYHIITLAGTRSKAGTLIDWSYDYFYRRSTAKLD